MKNKKQNTILKAIALAATWLTLSPLLLILDRRWKLLPKWLRILLFLLSPLMLVVFLVIGIMVYSHYQYYWREHHFVRPRVIENITGVRMPKYKVMERNLKGALDYKDTFILEFKEIPDSTLYQALRNNDFEYRDGCYNFHLNWGSGLDNDEIIPKGEKGNYDYSMTICEGAQRFTVRVMRL